MRPLWLLPLILAGCVQSPQDDLAGAEVQWDLTTTTPRPVPPRRPHADNCGTPHHFKLCGVTWKPSHPEPIYAEQLDEILGDIPLSDMPTVIPKGAGSPAPAQPGNPARASQEDAGAIHRTSAPPGGLRPNSD
jgi:hypothetical protein